MIWIKEILKKVITTLRTFQVEIKDDDPKNIEVHLKKVYQRDNIDSLLPLITVEIYDILEDAGRLGTFTGVKMVREVDEDTVALKNYPDPYWIFLQFNILTEFKEDFIDIITQIEKKFRYRGTLYVPDNSEEEEEVALYMERIQFNEIDNLNEEEDKKTRLARYKGLFRYKITAELPHDDEEEVAIVKKRHFSVYNNLDI